MNENEQKILQECIFDIKQLIRYYEKEIENTDFFISKETTEAYKRYLFSAWNQSDELLSILHKE